MRNMRSSGGRESGKVRSGALGGFTRPAVTSLHRYLVASKPIQRLNDSTLHDPFSSFSSNSSLVLWFLSALARVPPRASFHASGHRAAATAMDAVVGAGDAGE